MAATRRYGITPQLDIEQILLEAQNRWLRPAEICEILRNYRRFRIAPEPPNRPPSGSLFLFDRKVLRYFRKDGHNWRKKKDNKTVKEAHERLKVGSVDVLHCYYAHGEENENFQRRSYWLLEEDFMHIVLVHYREVQGNRSSFVRGRDNDELSPSGPMETPASSNSFSNHNQMPFQATDAESLNSAQTSEYEDAESADNYQASSRYHPHIEFQQSEDGPVINASHLSSYFTVPSSNDQVYYPGSTSASNYFSLGQEDTSNVFSEAGHSMSFNGPQTQANMTSWNNVLENCATSIPGMSSQESLLTGHPSAAGVNTECGLSMHGEILKDAYGLKQAVVTSQVNSQMANAEDTNALTLNMEMKNASLKEGNTKYSYLLKQLSLDIPNSEEDGGLKKYDSFSRWMSKELEEVDESHVQSTSAHYWSTVESEGVVVDSVMPHNEDMYLLSPSLSQDQLFSIVDFSPSWAYAGLETKVIVTGRFLENKFDVGKCKWSCMFGEREVPAEVLADGVLRCRAPPLKSGRVPFYITCSNRTACSEVREFEYRESHPQYMEMPAWGSTNELFLHIRLEKLLSIDLDDYQNPTSSLMGEKLHLCNKVSSLFSEDDDDWSFTPVGNKEFSPENARDHLLEKLLKQKLHAWLVRKIVEDGKGPSVLDKEGQGVLHLAAALDYDWAIVPTIVAGVRIDFRDVHGWTALHWAAFYGREKTVVALTSLGAAPGALTDPTPEFPGGRTPADLASSNGHKGIAGFLAESSLTKHLSMLTVKEAGTSNMAAISDAEAVDVAAATTIWNSDTNMQAGLTAVRNAAQAAARIHQVFRIHSFHRKKLAEYEDDKFGISDDQALSLISFKSKKTGPYDEPVAAAIRIQNKFRGWKGRKDFLIMRQRIVKIQAHVRGHLVRKHYKKIVWTVGIVEKAILRWRRKGSGLRGYRSERLIETPSVCQGNNGEDDYDFLKEGRKQTEARLEKALARVKSMVQYPEARDQYQRLLTNVDEFQGSKVLERVLNDTEVGEGDMMCDIDELLGDDSYFTIG